MTNKKRIEAELVIAARRAMALYRKYLEAMKPGLEGQYFTVNDRGYFIEEVLYVVPPIQWPLKLLIPCKCRLINSKGEKGKLVTANICNDAVELSDIPFVTPSETRVYKGKIELMYNGYERDILSLDELDYPLAEAIQEGVQSYGDRLTVTYWLSDSELEEWDIEGMKPVRLEGKAIAEYDIIYPEMSEYIGTNETIIVGDADLKGALKAEIGCYLYMKVEYDH